MREKNTGISGVTNRMELVQRLRASLVKTRLLAVALGLVVVVLTVAVVMLSKELKETRAMVNDYAKVETSLNTEIKELEQELEDTKQEVKMLSGFGNKIEIAMNIEDIVREAVSDIEYTTDTLEYKTRSGKKVATDMEVINYVLNNTTGEVVKVIQNDNHMFVVYISNKKTAKELEQAIAKEYYIGTERYEDVIKNHDNTLLVRHDIR